MVFRTSKVSANPRLEIEEPLCCCSVQVQKSAATLIVKIPQHVNCLANRVIWVMVGKLGELPKFLVLNSGTESFGNSSVSAFSSLLFALVQNYSLAF
jgi:hypothetical protein